MNFSRWLISLPLTLPLALVLTACLQPNPINSASSDQTESHSESPVAAKVALEICGSSTSSTPHIICRTLPCPVSCPVAGPKHATYFGAGAFELAANNSNEVYGLDYRTPSDLFGFPLLRFFRDGSSVVIPALVASIDMQGDTLWATSKEGEIFFHKAPIDGANFETTGFTVDGVSGYYASDVAVAANGGSDVYVLSTETVLGGNKIYKYTGSGSDYMPIDGALVQIDVADDGTLWGINSSGVILRHRPPVTGNNWKTIDIKIKGKTRFFARAISVGGGEVFALGADSVAGGFPVYRYSGKRKKWFAESEGVATLSVNRNGDVWGANLDQKIYTHDY